MLQSFKVKQYATFNNVGIEIDNLKKVNFFYGANGTGKTTITNFLNSPELECFGNCEVVWEHNMPLKVLTYNKKFREDQFEKGIDGVFTLGKATKEDLKRIKEMQTELDKINEAIKDKKNTCKKQKEEQNELQSKFTEQCWQNVYKRYETIFNEAFEGLRSKKEKFTTRLLSEYQQNKSSLKDIDELKKKTKTIFGETPPPLNELGAIDFTRLMEIENNGIWNKKIIGKSDIEIAKLIQRLKNNDWVNQGRQFIEEDSEICPFCQKNTIDQDFRKQLEEYFDEAFVADTELIDTLSQKYSEAYRSLLNQLQQTKETESSNSYTKLDIAPFSSSIKILKEQFSSNEERLKNKIKEPSRSIVLISTKEQLTNIQKLLLECNKEIKKHNEIVKNIRTEKSNLITEIWRYLIDENKIVIEEYLKKFNGLEKGIGNINLNINDLQDNYSKLNDEIKEANKNITSVQASIDAINDTLTAYGFDNFKIVKSDTEPNKYQIQREDGVLVEKTLSEGEITFVTFLYYLERVKGGISEDTIMGDRILVIDDPISSLDSTVLFVVSSLLKEIIKDVKKGIGNIKQILIFTHNVYFYKEVSFIDRSDNNRDDVHHWIIRKKDNVSTIKCYEKNNPIRGSYELLWDELKQRDMLTDISIQNTMRKILEVYFKTMGGYGNDELINSFKNKSEREICRSLLCWANDGSHCIFDDFFMEHPEQMIEKYCEVFKQLFVNMGHIQHYNMMMGVENQE